MSVEGGEESSLSCEKRRRGLEVEDVTCPICLDVLDEPVMGLCGHDFCKDCIQRWLSHLAASSSLYVCPVCRAPLPPFGLFVCYRLNDIVERQFSDEVAAKRKRLCNNQQKHAEPVEHEPGCTMPGTSTEALTSDQRWLLFLRHCAKCRKAPNECALGAHCGEGKELWQHLLAGCSPQCQYPRCHRSKRLLVHHARCQDVNCSTCGPIFAYVAQHRISPQESVDEQTASRSVPQHLLVESSVSS